MLLQWYKYQKLINKLKKKYQASNVYITWEEDENNWKIDDI